MSTRSSNHCHLIEKLLLLKLIPETILTHKTQLWGRSKLRWRIILKLFLLKQVVKVFTVVSGWTFEFYKSGRFLHQLNNCYHLLGSNATGKCIYMQIATECWFSMDLDPRCLGKTEHWRKRIILRNRIASKTFEMQLSGGKNIFTRRNSEWVQKKVLYETPASWKLRSQWAVILRYG